MSEPKVGASRADESGPTSEYVAERPAQRGVPVLATSQMLAVVGSSSVVVALCAIAAVVGTDLFRHSSRPYRGRDATAFVLSGIAQAWAPANDSSSSGPAATLTVCLSSVLAFAGVPPPLSALLASTATTGTAGAGWLAGVVNATAAAGVRATAMPNMSLELVRRTLSEENRAILVQLTPASCFAVIVGFNATGVLLLEPRRRDGDAAWSFMTFADFMAPRSWGGAGSWVRFGVAAGNGLVASALGRSWPRVVGAARTC